MPKSQIQPASTVRPLDKSGFIPLYYQIQRALMEKIHSGELSAASFRCTTRFSVR